MFYCYCFEEETWKITFWRSPTWQTSMCQLPFFLATFFWFQETRQPPLQWSPQKRPLFLSVHIHNVSCPHLPLAVTVSMTLTYFLLDFLISKVFIDVLLICDVILHQNLGAMRKKKSLFFVSSGLPASGTEWLLFIWNKSRKEHMNAHFDILSLPQKKSICKP